MKYYEVWEYLKYQKENCLGIYRTLEKAEEKLKELFANKPPNTPQCNIDYAIHDVCVIRNEK